MQDNRRGWDVAPLAQANRRQRVTALDEDPALQPAGRSQAACLFADEIGALPLSTAAPAATEEAAS